MSRISDGAPGAGSEILDIHQDLGRRTGGRVCFRADIDRQWTLPMGAPEDVRALVERFFNAFGRFDGGYVGWGEMSSDVSIANCEAMLAAMFGLRYSS